MRSRAEDRHASHTAPAGALGSAKEFRVRISAVPSPGPQQGACPRGRRVSACAHHTDAIHADCTDYVVMVAGFHWHSCRLQQAVKAGHLGMIFVGLLLAAPDHHTRVLVVPAKCECMTKSCLRLLWTATYPERHSTSHQGHQVLSRGHGLLLHGCSGGNSAWGYITSIGAVLARVPAWEDQGRLRAAL